MNTEYIRKRIGDYKLQIIDESDKQGVEHIIKSRNGSLTRDFNLLETLDYVLTTKTNLAFEPSRKGRVIVYANLSNDTMANDCFPYSGVRIVVGMNGSRIYSFSACRENKINKIFAGQNSKDMNERWEEWEQQHGEMDTKARESLEGDNVITSGEIKMILNGDISNLKDKIHSIYKDERLTSDIKNLMIKIIKGETLEGGINMDSVNEFFDGVEEVKVAGVDFTEKVLGELGKEGLFKPENESEQGLVDKLVAEGLVKAKMKKGKVKGYETEKGISIVKSEEGFTVERNHVPSYQGIFVMDNGDEVLKCCEGKVQSDDFHVTFKMGYKGTEGELPLGQSVDVVAYARGVDAENEGLAVKFSEKFDAYYQNKNQPHITTGVAEGGKAFNTGKLDFNDEIELVELEGVTGVMTKEGEIIVDANDLSKPYKLEDMSFDQETGEIKLEEVSVQVGE